MGGRADVDIRVHAAENHMFTPGTGPSMPAEYSTSANVDPAVIDDIASWIDPDASRGSGCSPESGGGGTEFECLRSFSIARFLDDPPESVMILPPDHAYELLTRV